VVFEESSGWEKMVLVTPGHSRSVIEMLRHRSSEPELMQARYDVLVPERVYPQGYSLKVMVPKDQLGGEPQPHWGYQCFALGYAPENLAHKQFQNMQVQRFTSEQHFGGGNDYQGDPNVLDLLAPSKQEQFRWLSNYASRQYRDANRYAVVPMMRAHVPDRTVFAPESPPASTATPVDPAPLFSSSAAPPPPKPVEIPSKPAKEFAREDPDARYRRSASRVQRDVEIPPEQTRELSSPEFSFELDPGVKE
jgi:hypothetical protein